MSEELILIVEDNEKNLKLVRDLLQIKGYRTVEAQTAEEGLHIAEEMLPSLILMDIHLPGMNGIEALECLRADPKTKAIPVVAVTASVMNQDRDRIIAAGFNGYQRKPIEIRAFLSESRQVLGENQLREDAG